jgi:hypothetical protein
MIGGIAWDFSRAEFVILFGGGECGRGRRLPRSSYGPWSCGTVTVKFTFPWLNPAAI